ncbi:uncharacterized protein TRIADDRAFT_61624 [Trichoplax adhaerens]|uniref:Uncharacterized protein n=1 Tax=Trichoplax adhaerens TaxID=10228 RepID=B3SBI0_TRIAD|nr:predicted protein [Trichoplax adhaerens]EDV19856.1 predicted protein [Trichoplax adhaerens]|eukprot:XP_002117598.1 predicted protein [Trichoplax adhaerens]
MPTNPTLHLQESSQLSEHSHSNNPLAMPVNIRTVSIIIGSIILIIGLISVTLGCVPYVFLEIRHDPNVATAINIWAGAMYIICGSLAIVNHCQRINHRLMQDRGSNQARRRQLRFQPGMNFIIDSKIVVNPLENISMGNFCFDDSLTITLLILEAGRRPKVRFSEPETALSNQSSLPLK